MHKVKDENLIKGWFIGNFEPSCLKTTACEVAYKKYNSGFTEPSHYHKIATEITYVMRGVVRFNSEIYEAGDIITVEPYDVVKFESLTNSETICVKIPGVLNDKYETDIT